MSGIAEFMAGPSGVLAAFSSSSSPAFEVLRISGPFLAEGVAQIISYANKQVGSIEVPIGLPDVGQSAVEVGISEDRHINPLRGIKDPFGS
jgi:hypothetical protein